MTRQAAPSRPPSDLTPKHQTVLAEVAERALVATAPIELWSFAVTALAAGVAADAAALLEVSPRQGGGRLAVVAHAGLLQTDDLDVDEPGFDPPFDVEVVGLDSTDPADRRAVARWLHREGHRFAAAVAVGEAGSLLLVVSRRQAAFDAGSRLLLGRVARVLSLAEQRRALDDVAQRQLSQQEAVASLGQLALATDDVTEVMAEAIRLAASILGVETTAVFERDGDRLVVRAACGWLEDEVGMAIAADQLISNAVMRSGEPLIINDFQGDSRFIGSVLATRHACGSIIIVPVVGRLQPVGTMTACSPRSGCFSADGMAFLCSLGQVIGLAMERARTQSQLHLSIDGLRQSAHDRTQLLSHIVDSHEEERQRIGNDIHDDAVQVMTAVALRLATVRRRLGADASDPVLLGLEHDVLQSIARLRHLMFVLSPPALAAHGLSAALHAYLAQVGEENGLAFTLNDCLTVEPDAEARTIAYRIAQKAVDNVCKYARATRVDVVLAEAGDAVLVEIRDDGIGFDIEGDNDSDPTYLGRLAMRARAEQSDGWWKVASEPGVGTTVRFCVGSDALRQRNLARLRTLAKPAGTGVGGLR